MRIPLDRRRRSVIVQSLFSVHLLSFVFEGPVLYALANQFGAHPERYVFPALVCHFVGLSCCGFFVKTLKAAKRAMLLGIGVCCFSSLPFFFPESQLWRISLIVCSLAAGCVLASWGAFLKSTTPKEERIKTSADMIVISHTLIIPINAIAIYVSPRLGLACAMLSLLLAAALARGLSVEEIPEATAIPPDDASEGIRLPLLILVAFVAFITINSGLMYQVLVPAFPGIEWLSIWYFEAPYIAAILLMRSLPQKTKRSRFLYVGIAMMMLAFLAFMLSGRSVADYLLVMTLMLSACGIFDLFWWSILGEMLDYGKNPVRIFGIGLSANILGIIIGGAISRVMTLLELPAANVTVIALTVVCITLVLLPPLNRWLVLLLKSHTYLNNYASAPEPEQRKVLARMKALDPLTRREEDVLRLLIAGNANRAISEELSISENTVKTHLRNIYSKYDVSSRAELISLLLGH